MVISYSYNKKYFYDHLKRNDTKAKQTIEYQSLL